jgi:hypothetical protein
MDIVLVTTSATRIATPVNKAISPLLFGSCFKASSILISELDCLEMNSINLTTSPAAPDAKTFGAKAFGPKWTKVGILSTPA